MISMRLIGLVILSLIAQIHAADDDQERLNDSLFVSLQNKAPIERIESLVKRRADVTAKDIYGASTLHYAAQYKTDSLVLFLLGYGLDVNAKDNFGDTPLHDACYKGCLETVQVFFARGADTQAKDRVNRTPLDYARDRGDEDIVKLIEDYENAPEAKEPEGD